MSLTNEREIIKVTTGITGSNNTTVIPFNNVIAGKSFVYVTEIIRIVVHGQAGGGSALQLYRGEIESSPSNAQNSNLICFYDTGNVANANTYLLTQQFDYHDGAGNGLIVPENALSAVSSTESIIYWIYYKMRKLRNEDLFVLMYNQGTSNN